MTRIDQIRADIRTAYEAIAAGDDHRVTQYARSAHSAIIAAALDGDTEAASLEWMVLDLI